MFTMWRRWPQTPPLQGCSFQPSAEFLLPWPVSDNGYFINKGAFTITGHLPHRSPFRPPSLSEMSDCSRLPPEKFWSKSCGFGANLCICCRASKRVPLGTDRDTASSSHCVKVCKRRHDKEGNEEEGRGDGARMRMKMKTSIEKS